MSLFPIATLYLYFKLNSSSSTFRTHNRIYSVNLFRIPVKLHATAVSGSETKSTSIYLPPPPMWTFTQTRL
jgi:hypothetical protein